MVRREAPRSHSDFQSASPSARSKKLETLSGRCSPLRAERESGARRAGRGEQQIPEAQKHTRRTNSDQRNPPRAAVFLGVYGRFAAVTAEIFVFFFAASRRSWRRFFPPSWRSRRRSFLHQRKNNAKFALHTTSAV